MFLKCHQGVLMAQGDILNKGMKWRLNKLIHPHYQLHLREKFWPLHNLICQYTHITSKFLHQFRQTSLVQISFLYLIIRFCLMGHKQSRFFLLKIVLHTPFHHTEVNLKVHPIYILPCRHFPIQCLSLMFGSDTGLVILYMVFHHKGYHKCLLQCLLLVYLHTSNASNYFNYCITICVCTYTSCSFGVSRLNNTTSFGRWTV